MMEFEMAMLIKPANAVGSRSNGSDGRGGWDQDDGRGGWNQVVELEPPPERTKPGTARGESPSAPRINKYDKNGKATAVGAVWARGCVCRPIMAAHDLLWQPAT